jgi:glycosyltransferase involved in cell wall biosynthesis
VKVFQVLSKFLPQQIAGTEVYTFALSKQLQQKEIDVKVVIPNYGEKVASEYVYKGLTVHQYAEPSVVNRQLIMGLKAPEGLQYFTKLIEDERPDIIHFHELAGSNGITLHHVKEAQKIGIKVLMTLHLATYSCMTGSLLQNGLSNCSGKIELKKCTECYLSTKKLEKSTVKLLTRLSILLNLLGINSTKLSNRFATALGSTSLVKKKRQNLLELVNCCDKVVVLNNWYKEILVSNGISPNKITLITQGLPVHRTLKKGVKPYSDILKFIFVGRISYFKGIHLLIDAFMQLDYTKAELHIYGQTDDSIYENDLKKKSNLFQNIKWKGKLSQSDVVSTMNNYDAFCLCSTITEMSPLVIQEAFIAGIPVIASNVYGNAEQINHGINGLLFNINDSVDLLTQLNRCLYEIDLLPSLVKNITPPKSFDKVGDEYMELYKSILN